MSSTLINQGAAPTIEYECFELNDKALLSTVFVRPLLQKGSSLQEEILSVCLSVITFSFSEYFPPFLSPFFSSANIYHLQIFSFSNFFPPFPSLFVCSSAGQIISLPKYFPPFPFLYYFLRLRLCFSSPLQFKYFPSPKSANYFPSSNIFFLCFSVFFN